MKKIIFAIACVILCACSAENSVGPDYTYRIDSYPEIEQQYWRYNTPMIYCGETFETATFVTVCNRPNMIFPVNGKCPTLGELGTGWLKDESRIRNIEGFVVCRYSKCYGYTGIDIFGNCRKPEQGSWDLFDQENGL